MLTGESDSAATTYSSPPQPPRLSSFQHPLPPLPAPGDINAAASALQDALHSLDQLATLAEAARRLLLTARPAVTGITGGVTDSDDDATGDAVAAPGDAAGGDGGGGFGGFLATGERGEGSGGGAAAAARVARRTASMSLRAPLLGGGGVRAAAFGRPRGWSLDGGSRDVGQGVTGGYGEGVTGVFGAEAAGGEGGQAASEQLRRQLMSSRSMSQTGGGAGMGAGGCHGLLARCELESAASRDVCPLGRRRS